MNKNLSDQALNQIMINVYLLNFIWRLLANLVNIELGYFQDRFDEVFCAPTKFCSFVP